MKKLILFLSLILALVLSTSQGVCQENYATNIKTEISGADKMLITYDIEAKDGARFFNVIILLTSNGQQIKANSAYGDYGSKISPGAEKAIVWYFSNDFEGDIQKVEVEVFAYKENEPKAVFRLQSIGNNGYSPCEVVFTNHSTYANEYKWDFGDPTSGIRNHSFDKEPTHTYEKGGLYHISLVASNQEMGMESTFYYSLEVLEHPPVIAEFEYSTSSIEAPFEVIFTDNSTNADSFVWDFGDPGSGRKNTSSGLSPKHKYKEAGTFTVKLTVSNSTTGLTHTQSKELVLQEPELPAANFIFTLSSEIAPSIAVFKNTSTNANSYSWDFGDTNSGDNNRSSETNPSHTFAEAGSFEVKMTAINTQTGKSTNFSQIVEVAEPPKAPVAKFVIENNNVIAPATIIFKNTSEHADRYTWNFGDSDSGDNTSSRAEPTHTYTTAGRYEVTLTSYSTAADQSDKLTDFVIIIEPAKPPLARFVVEISNQTAPATVSFRNTSSNAQRYTWDFGDPDSGDDNSSTLTSPTHTYSSAGRYKIVLIGTNTESGEISNHTEYVVVNEPIKLPVANFTIVPGDLTTPAVVNFTNSSSDADSYSWDFGDPASGEQNISSLKDPSHTYRSAGRFKVVLISSSEKAGETSTHFEYVTVVEPAKIPVAGFSVELGDALVPVVASFKSSSQNTSRYSWDFGDPGSGDLNTSSLENPTHTYSKGGRYEVVLICSNSESEETSRHSEYLTVTEPVILPVPDFEFDSQQAIAPAVVSFSNKSSKADSYTWNFGDPGSGSQNTSTETNPTHTYEKEGDYEVVLSAVNQSSGEIRNITRRISISKPVPPPIADFTFSIVGDVAPIDVSFSNNSSNGDTYSWNFGDSGSANNESIEINPSHRYENPGIYTVSLTLTNSTTGMTDEFSKDINVVSEYVTFVQVLGEEGREEIATSIIESISGEFFVLVNDTVSGSKIISLDEKGEILQEKDLGAQVFDIASDGEKFVLGGFQEPGNLTIQNMSLDLDVEEPVLLEGVANLDRKFSTPNISVADNGEVGIVGNKIEAGVPVDIWFQKLDINGDPVPVKGMTFKFMGIKLENELISSEDGGFAITGFWQEDENKPKRLMFASVDETGKGFLKAITAVTNFVGCDIVKSHTGGYGILSAQGSPLDESVFNIVFMAVDLDGGPMSFSGNLHGDLFLDDIQKFPPSVIQTEGGYVVASYAHNGTDYDINIIWIDVSGEMIMKKEIIKRPGDQFVTDIIKVNDGSFIIIGAERIDEHLDALIIRTDPFGKVNQGDDSR